MATTRMDLPAESSNGPAAQRGTPIRKPTRREGREREGRRPGVRGIEEDGRERERGSRVWVWGWSRGGRRVGGGEAGGTDLEASRFASEITRPLLFLFSSPFIFF